MITVLEARLKLSKEEKQDEPIKELDGFTVKMIRNILLDYPDYDCPVQDLRLSSERIKYWLLGHLQENH